jgi:Flp pilus assembly protein TadG
MSPMLRCLLQDEKGAIAVETSLVTSLILVPMLLGIWDIAQVGFGQAQVQEALQAAVTYVAAGNSGNAAGITSAAQTVYGTSMNVSTNTVCYCVSTTSSSLTTPSTVSCTSSCGSGNDFEQFMTISVSKSVTIPFSVPYLGSSVTVKSSGSVRTG